MRLSLSEQQQHEMRYAYYDGAPGILVSGLVWIASALVCYLSGIGHAVGTLLIGGALIYPISAIATKAMGRPAKTNKANALNHLGMASTIWLSLCCAMAYKLFLFEPSLFFPVMMATIGSRYLIFASMYGRSIFWALGVTLIVGGGFAFNAAIAPAIAAGLGGLIELVFAFLVLLKAGKPARPPERTRGSS